MAKKTKDERKLQSAQTSAKNLREESKESVVVATVAGAGAAFVADVAIKYLPAPSAAEMAVLKTKKAKPFASKRVKWALGIHALALLAGARGPKSAAAIAATTAVLTLAVQTTKAAINNENLSTLATETNK